MTVLLLSVIAVGLICYMAGYIKGLDAEYQLYARELDEFYKSQRATTKAEFLRREFGIL